MNPVFQGARRRWSCTRPRLNECFARGLAMLAMLAAASPGFAGADHVASVRNTAAPTDELIARIPEFIERTMADLQLVPGLSVAVIRNDQIVYEQGFGAADLEVDIPVTSGTVFYTASLAKSFTGMTASVLSSRSELDLDAPLSRYLPALHLNPPLSAELITLRDLLRHTPGFDNSGINFTSSFVGSFSDEEFLRVLNDYSTPTDGRFHYSNTNYVLVAKIIERATEQPWQKVMADLVFKPLRMDRSTAYLSQVPASSLAAPYVAGKRGFKRIPMLKTDQTITGAGGIFSTAGDLARFVVANLNDGQVDGRRALPAKAIRISHQPQVSLAARFYEFDRHAYGLGFYLAEYDGDLLIHHFGGFPGYRSHLSFMPEHGLGVVVLQNEGRDGNPYADLVATYIYDLLLGKSDTEARAGQRVETLREGTVQRRDARAMWETNLARLQKNPPDSALPLQAYAGFYENERLGRLRIKVANDRPQLHVAFGALSGPAFAAGRQDFLVDWMPGSQPDTFTFDIDDHGAISGFHWGSRPFSRMPGMQAEIITKD